MRVTIALVLLAVCAACAATRPAQDGLPLLTVSGEGELSARPDHALVSLGASAQAPEAAAAQREVSQTMQRALDALRGAGLTDDDVQTTGLSLAPVYRSPTPDDAVPEPRIVAYRASNSLRVEVDDPSAVGAVIDAAISAGANELQGISFELRDDQQQRLAALRSAVADARARATALAEAANVRLVELWRIDVGGIHAAPLEYSRSMAFDAATPIQPGQVRVSASVTLTYRVAAQRER